ncbi:MAG: phytanoyl-CoA dioxygenase family protein [Hyphomicrobiales bacterium]
MDTNSPDPSRCNRHWLKAGSGSLEKFKALVSTRTDVSQWPFAASVQDNILIYDGDVVRRAAADAKARLALMSEWIEVFSAGPGVIVIAGALSDQAVVDGATKVFEALIDQQHRDGTGSGDHFARPGANDRVWNALQKHCLADGENFVRYFGNVAIDLACRAWLGDGYQMTTQVNRVNPGGEAQLPHRDYHLGFMSPDRMLAFPAHVHHFSTGLTLQGAVAHTDMPLQTGPTRFLPYSQMFPQGYVAFGGEDYQVYFNAHYSQLPLAKGDAVFFNPALMHAAGANVTTDTYRTANLLQVSSALGRAMETVDRAAMVRAVYPALLEVRLSGQMSAAEISCAIAACAEGYAFPTNLDRDPPIGGMSPRTQAQIMTEALADELLAPEFGALVDELAIRQSA